jgi:hypothetical protein
VLAVRLGSLLEQSLKANMDTEINNTWTLLISVARFEYNSIILILGRAVDGHRINFTLRKQL